MAVLCQGIWRAPARRLLGQLVAPQIRRDDRWRGLTARKRRRRRRSGSFTSNLFKPCADDLGVFCLLRPFLATSKPVDDRLHGSESLCASTRRINSRLTSRDRSSEIRTFSADSRVASIGLALETLKARQAAFMAYVDHEGMGSVVWLSFI